MCVYILSLVSTQEHRRPPESCSTDVDLEEDGVRADGNLLFKKDDIRNLLISPSQTLKMSKTI